MPVVHHKKYRNMGLHAAGVDYQIDSDGRLAPDPDAAAALMFTRLPNYDVTSDPTPAPAAAEEPAEGSATPVAAAPAKLKSKTKKKKKR